MMRAALRADIVIGGVLPTVGPVLRLDGSLSFWGGVDPATGCLSDPRSDLHGRAIGGTILMVAEPAGSSSSSAVILELFYRGIAPAALILGAVDAIVGLGILVAAEMGLPVCPLLYLPAAEQRCWPQGSMITIGNDGQLNLVSGQWPS